MNVDSQFIFPYILLPGIRIHHSSVRPKLDDQLINPMKIIEPQLV